MTSLSPSRAGDDPSPKDISIRSLMPKSFCHTGWPSCVEQYTPRDPKKAITWLASTNTEGEAKLPYCAWKPSCGVVTMATFSQSCLPVLRSKASKQLWEKVAIDRKTGKQLWEKVLAGLTVEGQHQQLLLGLGSTAAAI